MISNDFYHMYIYVLYTVFMYHIFFLRRFSPRAANQFYLTVLSLSLNDFFLSFFFSRPSLFLFLLLLSTLICRVSRFYNCVPSHAGHPRNSY